MSFLRSRRGVAVLAAVVLLLFLVRPGVSQLRKRIAGSIGSALGRKVALDNVRVHLLPRPGFDLEGLVIYDDPAFSAEPMVRAQDVSAAIRFRSLLRGRLEIATLSATEPSINLVRNEQGRWNLASLIERNSRIPAAPTGKTASERRPGFPYLEATNARINFKVGQAKKSWALTDADVALWQDSENSWGARIKAQPVRTDFNMTDTGLIQVNASWQRAANLGDTPVQMEMQWQKGQLGQITKLLSGRDRGWRGGVTLAATLSGTPRALAVRSQASIQEFRRYDIMSAGAALAATCEGRYSTEDGLLRDLDCATPLLEGSIRLRGNVNPLQASGNLALDVQKLPLATLLQFSRNLKKGLPRDLAAAGKLDFVLEMGSGPTGLPWTGAGTLTGARLSFNAGKDEIVVGNIPLIVRSGDGTRRSRPASTREGEPAGPHLQIGPFPAATGGTTPATASGWISGSGYRLGLRGETEIKALYRLANALGLAGLQPIADGAARVDLQMSGAWQGFAAPLVTGNAQLHNVHTGVRGLNPAISLASATLTLDAETASLDKIAAQTGDTRWSGSVKVARHCAAEPCPFQFDLAADQLSSAGIVEWFTPHPAKRPWYRILSSADAGKSPLLDVRARGRLRVNHLTLKKVEATQISTQLDLAGGRVTLDDLRAQIFQGTHQGRWTVDASALPLRMEGKGELQNVSMVRVSAAMNDEWVSGTADGTFSLATSGGTFAEMLRQADGDLRFTLRNGSLPHLDIPSSARPLSVHTLTGDLQVSDGVWKLEGGKLQSHDGLLQVKGTASPGKGLNFLLIRNDEAAWTVSGTLSRPIVSRATHTEARAKP